jgi:hypothetical protein
MSFTGLGAIPFLVGLAVIAGVLFLLQRLRVRFREREVVTTLFWKQALEETRARMLTRRFRHPLPYLLALAIGALIWLAFAGPKWDRSGADDCVFLLDGSAGMASGDRFEKSKLLLRQEVDRVSADRRRVYFCGAEARLILDRGEEASLLIPRLAAMAPEACPASVEREALAIAADAPSSEKLHILVVGDAAVRESALGMLPDHVRIDRLRSENATPPPPNKGIATLGVAEAASGAFDRVDVRIAITGKPDSRLAITLGGEPLDQAPTAEEDGYYLRDLPAQGEVLEVAMIENDALPLDDRARITLPDRRTVEVVVDPNLDSRFQAVVEADSALVAATGNARVAVGGAADGSLPAVELVTGDGIAIIHEPNPDPAELEELRARFAATGLDRVGRKLGSAAGRADGFALVPRFVPGAQRRVQIGVELIGDDYDFMQTSAFPLFLSTALRWLGGVEAPEPFAVAGERSVHPGRFAIAGSDYAPPRAGHDQDRDGRKIELSLAAVEAPQADALNPVTRATDDGVWPGLFAWCILAALLLVAGEWWLFQKSRIP